MSHFKMPKRRAGELLREGAFSPDDIARIRRHPDFDALYQQRPGGGGFHISEDSFPRFQGRPFGTSTVLSIDPASSGKKNASWSAFGAFRSQGDKEYVLDVLRVRGDFPEQRQALKIMIRRHNPSIILIEDTALGPALASGLGQGISVIRVPRPQMSKGERLRAILPWIEGRRIWLPDDLPWVLEFLAELMNFPSGGTDQVDMLTQYLIWRDGGNTAPPLRKPPSLGYSTSLGGARPQIRSDHIYILPFRRR